FNLDVTMGLAAAPSGGDYAAPFLDINSSSPSSAGGGTLLIEFSDSGYGPSSGLFLVDIGGTLADGASLVYDTYVGNGNGLFEKSALIKSMGPFTASPFSDSATSTVSVSNPYSLTLEVLLTHPPSGGRTIRSGFDAALEGCPLV